MRAVSRGSKPAPAALNQKNRQNVSELDRVRAYMRATLPAPRARKPFAFSAYKHEAVKQRLEELFHRKCAYCESSYASQAPVDVEHFRPKGRVEGEPQHPGYWWLAAEWTNLLPSCLDCNRRRKQLVPRITNDLKLLWENMQTGKKDCFPIAGVRAQAEEKDFSAERALLLDPTRDEPDEHLEYWITEENLAGIVFPARSSLSQTGGPALPTSTISQAALSQQSVANGISVRGAVSIQVYGLNRLRLVQERARLVQHLRFLESIVLEVATVKDRLEVLNASLRRTELREAVDQLERLKSQTIDQMRTFAMPSQPYSALAKAYLADFKARIVHPVVAASVV